MVNLTKRKLVWLSLLFLSIALGAAAYLLSRPHGLVETAEIGGVTIPAKVGSQYLQVYQDGAWHNLLLKGVNMGIAKPGYFPGETAITEDKYYRWFQQIGAMNANVIRIYTLHPPAFYEALDKYNSRAKKPLYVLHGVWIDEDKLDSTQDAYAKENTDEFIQDIQRTVDVVHGNADLPARPGHASGKYRANVSKYVIGWILGIEWNPEMVMSTNDKHKGMPDWNGAYFQTKNASPFEVWLSHTMDEVASYETEHYHWQHPVSFTNWVTADLLHHPSEPISNEDMVSVNPNAIFAKSPLTAGYFASYHVYPYYPDFLNYETKYTDYVDKQGKKNSYAGYLHDLRQAHRMPVLIAEFGVPGSRGMTHKNINGWNQGFLSEKQQGEIDAQLFWSIQDEGMAGGLVFGWQDEWFKRTWNTMDMDNPDRRPFWSNAQTGEQQFGMLSFDPGPKDTALHVDGDTRDWKKAKIKPLPMKDPGLVRALDDYDPQRKIERMFVSGDERYVYFRLDFARDQLPLDWSKANAMILLDTIPGQGQHQVPGGSGLTTEAGIDFAIDLKGPQDSRIWVDSYYDPFYYTYGPMLKMTPLLDYANRKDNGIFHREMLALNRPLTVPNVNGKTLNLPLQAYETGVLNYGNGNPDSPDYDSLADVSYDAKQHVVEVRIPWQLLNVKDPSTHEIMGDLWTAKGLSASETSTGIKLAALTYRPDGAVRNGPGGKDIAFASQKPVNDTLRMQDMPVYQWQGWEQPQYHERLKQSYDVMKNLFGSIQ